MSSPAKPSPQPNSLFRKIPRSIHPVAPHSFMGVNDFSFVPSPPTDMFQLGDMALVRHELDRIAEEKKQLQGEFCEVLAQLMKSRKISASQLSVFADLSSKTIGRYCRKGYPLPSLQHTLSICIGLNLHPDLAFVVLTKAGHTLDTGSSLHRFYRFLLQYCYMETLDSWNVRLKFADFDVNLPGNSSKQK